jgi:hypothetical protein
MKYYSFENIYALMLKTEIYGHMLLNVKAVFIEKQSQLSGWTLEKAHIPYFSVESLKYVMLLEGRRYEIILKK